ncbi:glycosyltransferase family 4 protein [Mucilaginibacter lutimaris]|uniref:Glycosyltransferase family 4 protein n=1 Tax=Mucilaginibacter lutimaris TaxID=931629 RepID=A0ABW2ZB67_9SPHI
MELNKIGVPADILSQYNLGFLDTPNDVKKWKDAGVPQIVWLNANTLGGVFSAVFKLVNLIRTNKYNYVITTNTGLDTIAAIARFFIKFKHLVALHDYPHGSVTKAPRFKLWRSLVVKSLFKAYAISDFVRNENLKYISIAPDKIQTIHNSIDLNTFTNDAGKETDITEKLNAVKGKKLLFIGRLVKRKGIDILLNVLSQLPHDVSLIIAGDSFDKAIEEGAANYRDEIISIIQQLKLEDRVVLLGQCKEVYTIMKQCDVMVHLARHEGFGLVLLEAFAAGLPVVTSNIGGIPEVLKDTSYKAIDLNNTEEIISEINYLLNMDAKEKQMITAQAKNTLEYFSDKRRAKDIAEKILI